MSSQRVRLRNLGVSDFDLVRKARQMFPEIQRRLDYAGGPISVADAPGVRCDRDR
jgi:hypothetical protein